MSKVSRTLRALTAAAAVALVAGGVRAAEPREDGRDGARPPPPARAEAPARPAPANAGRPATFPNRGEAPRPAPQAVTPRPAGPRPPAAVPQPPAGLHLQTPPPARAQVEPRRGDAANALRPQPGVGQQRAFRGVLPGQYHGDNRGRWHGAPPGFGGNRPHWNGGNWRGHFWPRVYYNWNYPLFLATLPGVYATYWWGDVPYYYVNNVYYTWSAPDGGYVVTDPPPMLSDDDLGAIEQEGQPGADDGSSYSADGGDNPPPDAYAPPQQGEIYAYPRNGQTSDQQARDKYECHAWATQQSGYDPTAAGANPAGSDAYRRAMIACLDARGYSAR